MSALDGFLSTWSDARATFGEGAPQTGASFDQSAPLSTLKSNLDQAAPGTHWAGGAATAYSGANTEHQRVIGELGGLDRRLAAQVSQSAQIVTAGRQDLDAVRTWVLDAAASLPKNQAAEQMLLPLVRRGLSQLGQIVARRNGELNTVGGSIAALGSEYQALGADQKFAPSLGVGDEEMAAPPLETRAQRDVEEALGEGDGDAAGRVDDALSSIEPGTDLTPTQRAYLSEMHDQQQGMSIKELKAAEDRLGDHKSIIANSWQLMSNDDVYFRDSDGDGHDDAGSAANLPSSVQETLTKATQVSGHRGDYGLRYADDLNDISSIVGHGDVGFQTGTELDREMMRAADRVMDSYGAGVDDVPEVAQAIFDSAGRDHQIVHDHLLGTHADDGDDFLHDVNRIDWPDGGAAAGNLFSWTNDPLGLETDIASATAEKYANYIGTHDELMDLAGGQNLGQLNPELAKAYAHGLTPYMADIASLPSGDRTDNFDFLDPGDPERPVAKQLFTAMATQDGAYREFMGAADQLALDRAYEYAQDVKNGVQVSDSDHRLLEGAVLKGLVDCGSTEAAHDLKLTEAEAAQRRNDTYSAAVAALSAASGPGAGALVGGFGAAMESSFVTPIDTTRPVIPDMPPEESSRFVVNALLAGGVDVPGIDPRYIVDGRIGSLDELINVDSGAYSDLDMQDSLNAALNEVVGEGRNPADAFGYKYNQITKVPNP